MTTTMTDLILSDDSRPGHNRVVSHMLLKSKELDAAPMAQHSVYYVHPPGTRSSPASFRSHFLMVVPHISSCCMLIWIGFELLPYIQSTFFDATHDEQSVWPCSQFRSSSSSSNYDAASTWYNPMTWFRPFALFLWMNTACGLVQVLQDDIRKNWRRFDLTTPSGQQNWSRSYGRVLPPLNGNPLVAQQMKDTTLRFVLLFNFLFFSMSYGDFNLKIGTLLIGILFVHFYQRGMAPLNTAVDPAGQPMDNAWVVGMKNTWSKYAVGYSLAAPLLMVTHKVANSIGLGNIWNAMLAVGVGTMIGMMLDILPRIMNGRPLLTYTKTMQGCISIALGGYLWKRHTLSWQEVSCFVVLHCVAGIACMPYAIRVENQTRNVVNGVRVFIFDVLLWFFGMALIFALALVLSSKGWQWGFDDIQGTTMTTAMFVVAWYTLYYFLPKLLPNVV